MQPGILSTIGCTPLLPLKMLYPHRSLRLYAKLEMFNPGGSIKDRPALLMLSKALEQGRMRQGDTVVESSSGNMAIGLAQACCFYGLKLLIVTDPKTNRHTLKMLKAYGAGIEQVTASNAYGNYLSARLDRVKTLSERPDFYWPNQYASKWNPAANYYTMQEIVNALDEPPDYLLAATSTCGTIMGCVDYVQDHKLETQIVAVDAVGSVIFGAPAACRLVPGYGASRSSGLLRREAIDRVIHISDEECVKGCRRLLDTEAILAGGSSGAVVAAVEKMRSDLPERSTCVCILPDSGERYLDTIYNDKWVEEHFAIDRLPIGSGASVGTCNDYRAATNGTEPSKTDPQRIAIAGGGPKGMYGFERLTAGFKAYPPENKVEIHVFNRTNHFGSGDNYRPDQPAYLLTNNAAEQINMWIDEEPAPVAPISLSLTEWLQANGQPNFSGRDFVSRATVGQYLEDGFEQIAANLPPGVSAEFMIGEVTDIAEETDDKMAIELQAAGGSRQMLPHQYDYVLLATGHPRNKADDEGKKLQNLAKTSDDFNFIPHIYPVQEQLRDIRAGDAVAIKGIGLTFVDAVLALTEGRGGRFERNTKNYSLVYQCSGSEPDVIYPFSRSGLPMVPRAASVANVPPLGFLTAQNLRLRNRQPGPMDFQKHILPLLKKELAYTFYYNKIKNSVLEVDLSRCDTFAKMKHHINAFHSEYPEAKRFHADDFLAPLQGKEIQSGQSFHKYILKYLQFFINEVRKKEELGPWAVLTSVWRRAAPAFSKIYAFGGLSPASQRYFDQQYRRRLERVTFGPPVRSMEKLVCLMKTGRIDFSLARNPRVHINRSKGTIALESGKAGVRRDVQQIIDARIAPVSLRNDQSPLYQNLLNRGMITLYERKEGSTVYRPGNLALSRDGFAINAAGKEDRRIAVTGTPTEGITYDNDALSRHRNNFVSDWATFICETRAAREKVYR